VVGPDGPLPNAVAWPVASIVIGFAGKFWAACVSGGVTDMIEIASSSDARRVSCVHLSCISVIFRRLLGGPGISMFAGRNIDVSHVIYEKLNPVYFLTFQLLKLRLYVRCTLA